MQEVDDEENFLVDDSDEGHIKKKKKQKAKKRRAEEEDEEDEPVEVHPPHTTAKIYHSIDRCGTPFCKSVHVYFLAYKQGRFQDLDFIRQESGACGRRLGTWRCL